MDIDNKNTNSKTDEVSTSDIVSDILIKYNLKENEEELTKKYFGDEGESNGGTIFWVASKLIDGENTEKNLITILEERLHISQKIAEQIMEEIKKILLPVLKEDSVKKNIMAASTPPKAEPIAEVMQEPIQKLEQKNIIKKKEKRLPPIGHEKETSITQQNNNLKRKNDTYREPIE